MDNEESKVGSRVDGSKDGPQEPNSEGQKASARQIMVRSPSETMDREDNEEKLYQHQTNGHVNDLKKKHSDSETNSSQAIHPRAKPRTIFPSQVASDSETPKDKPASTPRAGVILLGRGNSFSLGRSEVIVLHNRPSSNGEVVKGARLSSKRLLGDSGSKDRDHLPLQSIQEQTSSSVSSNLPSSPPPVSEVKTDNHMLTNPTYANGCNGMGGKLVGDSKERQEVMETDNGGDGDTMMTPARISMQQLWAKAEDIMAAHQDRVLSVLEDFGIGGSAAGGGGDEDGQQGEEEGEEDVWRIVEATNRQSAHGYR